MLEIALMSALVMFVSFGLLIVIVFWIGFSIVIWNAR